MSVAPFQSPLVVGYKGEIGSFLLTGLLRVMPKASSIWCVDVNDTSREYRQRIRIAKEIFLCVPVQHTAAWLSRWKPWLHDKIIIEQCSVKAPVLSPFPELQILSMHVLFRPSATPLTAKRNVVLIANDRWGTWPQVIAQMTAATIQWYPTVQAHDASMAHQQAVVHRVLLTLADQLPSGALTYVSEQVAALAQRIRAGDPALYAWIQKNPATGIALHDFERALDEFHIYSAMQTPAARATAQAVDRELIAAGPAAVDQFDATQAIHVRGKKRNPKRSTCRVNFPIIPAAPNPEATNVIK